MSGSGPIGAVNIATSQHSGTRVPSTSTTSSPGSTAEKPSQRIWPSAVCTATSARVPTSLEGILKLARSFRCFILGRTVGTAIFCMARSRPDWQNRDWQGDHSGSRDQRSWLSCNSYCAEGRGNQRVELNFRYFVQPAAIYLCRLLLASPSYFQSRACEC
jgi:hypothetical protein